MKINGDSLVLSKSEPGNLCFDGVAPESVVARSTYEPGLEDTILYESGRDYVLDAERGTLARATDSRIPDFSTNVLYGQKKFDHTQFPGYGNHDFFVYVDYETSHGRPFAEESNQAERLPKTGAALRAGGPFKVIAYGDSITCGGEASTPRLQFPDRYARYLTETFPQAKVELENGATGGDSTKQGVARLEEKVLTRQPDLVLVGFGMNDNNTGSVPVKQFEDNLVGMITAIRERTGAEILLFSAFPPHPDWVHNSHRMVLYADATQAVAERTASAYADVFAVWSKVLERKDPSSLLANNINHPNDFGHWLYYMALKSVRF